MGLLKTSRLSRSFLYQSMGMVADASSLARRGAGSPTSPTSSAFVYIFSGLRGRKAPWFP